MNRRDFVTATGVALTSGLFMSSSACPPRLNETLDAITLAIDGFLSLNLIPQIPPALVPVIEGWLGQLTTAVEGAAVELSSTDTGIVKTEKVALLFANAVLPNLTGLTVQVVNEITGIEKLVTDFLADIGVGTSTAAVQSRAKMANVASAKTAVISASQAAKIIAHARQTAAKVKAL